MCSAAATRPRLLLVEHDQEIRTLLATLLQLEGYEPVEAPTLEEAYERIEQDLYDLVLTDLFSPATDLLRPADAETLASLLSLQQLACKCDSDGKVFCTI